MPAFATRNGPAAAGSEVRRPSLKTFGLRMACFGYSGVNSDRQSAYGLPKTTFTSSSPAPLVIFRIRSYPAFRAVQ